MKRGMVFRALAFLLVLQAQTVFAADDSYDFAREIRAGEFSKAERILKNNTNKWSVEEKSRAWWLAVCYQDVSSVRSLEAAKLLQKYNFSWGDNYVSSVISQGKSEELIRYLINIGMPIEGSSNRNTGIGVIALAIANRHGDSFVQFLLEKGVKVYATDLSKAAEQKRWSLVPLLVNRLSEDDMDYRLGGKTALMFAAEAGQRSTVRLLVEKGAKVNLRDDNGSTAASLAYEKGEIEVYNYLKANGAIDFEARQVTQQPATPAPSSTTNVYVQPSAPTQSATAQPAPRPATPTLRQGRYACSGTNITMDISTSIKLVTIYSGYTAVGQGSYTINGNSLAISILRITDEFSYMRGVTYEYNITSDTSFTDGRERWVRTGS